jgi:hypothetical protein
MILFQTLCQANFFDGLAQAHSLHHLFNCFRSFIDFMTNFGLAAAQNE